VPGFVADQVARTLVTTQGSDDARVRISDAALAGVPADAAGQRIGARVGRRPPCRAPAMSRAVGSIRALAFDLDGTLVDSAPDIGHALNRALGDAGLGSFAIERVREWIGDGPDALIDRALRALGKAGSAALHAELRHGFDRATLDAPLRHGHVYDGIVALLQGLHGRWPLAVVTNKPTPLARAVLEAAELLTHFASVHGADVAALRKPAPALLLQAAQAAGVAAHELLMVGDSGADLRAAAAAGSPAAWAAWGYGVQATLPLAPRWRVEHPGELLRIVGAG
jgi:phosphoglycolate phosphatase